MSKRPRTANAVMSRLRRPVGRLRDLPIWTKLGLIMLVPTLATIYVGTTGLVSQINQASDAERARTFALLSQASGDLADHVQNERAAAIWFQSTPREPDGRQRALELYNAEKPLVDAARRPYAQQKDALNNIPEKTGVLLLRLDRNLERLPSIRSQVSNGKKSREAAYQEYKDIVNDLLNVRDASAQLAGDTALSDHMRSAAAVARGKESVAQQRAKGLEALGVGQFPVPLRRDFLLTGLGADQAESVLQSVGTDSEVALYEQVVSGTDKRAATNLISYFTNKVDDNLADKTFDAVQWNAAMTAYGKLYRDVETNLDNRIVDEATTLHSDVQRRVFVQTSVLLGMLLLAILFAWLVARSMARSLRELRQGALSVAQFGLPHAVNRLRDPGLSTALTPAQLADQIAEPLPVRSRDEFGQVTEAFNAVHLEAVRTAAEQAALRGSVSTMFVNLARRSQILVDRLIGHLDRLERGEEDPDRLAELFQLDHLATRMRRNDENLLVLAGADSTRIQREPAALIDVLRAAQSEVEHYTRIEFGNVERDIEVSAHAVNDMVHLVAELFDNATAFSPPNSHVMVEAHHVGDRTVLVVEDRGIGISPEQLRDLNERLANPPTVDVAVSRMMGLVVVARLASRHEVRVLLRPAEEERGTVAEVDLPPAVLVPRALAGRLQQGSATAFDSGAQQQPNRPGFAAPLALESGASSRSVSPAPAGRPFDPNPPTLTGGMLGASGGRSVPAWSDLTGAPGGYGMSNSSGGFNGTNGSSTHGSDGFNGFGANGYGAANGFTDTNGFGANGFTDTNGFGAANGFSDTNGFSGTNGSDTRGPDTRRPDTRGPDTHGPDTHGPGTNGFGGASSDGGSFGARFGTEDDLPRRRAGESHPGGGDAGPYGQGGATIPRQLPANPGDQGQNPYQRPISAPPVSGVPVSGVPISGVPVSGPANTVMPPATAPRPGSETSDAMIVSETYPGSGTSPISAPPVSGAPTSESPISAPPISGPPISGPPVSAPPSWPPVVADRDSTGATPVVPESLVAALDMTAEIPRIRPGARTDGDAAESNASDRVASSVRPPLPNRAMPQSAPQSAAQRAAEHAAAAHEAAAAQAAEAQATAAAQIAAAQAAARQRAATDNQSRFDETMELPIFRELESAWFQTGHPEDGAANGAGRSDDPAVPVSAQRYSTADSTRMSGVPQQASSPESTSDRMADVSASGADGNGARKSALITAANGNGSSAGAAGGSWRTVADDGWQAARAAADLPVDTTTTAGLPRRTPMAQLVPGGVERAGASVQRRTPEAVRGLLSAYHRGVQRGRTKENPSNPEETPEGQQSSQAGKEHEG